MATLQAVVGLGVFVAAAWLASESRRAFPWRVASAGLLLQFALAVLLLRLPLVRDALQSLNAVVSAIETSTAAGAGFVFGYLGGAATPFEVSDGSALFVFAFRILPQILIFSVLVAILWHWRILPAVVRGMSFLLRKALGVGGAEGLSAAADIFLGMVESPLVIRAYLARLSRSELFTVMTCGMATVAGSVMILFTSLLQGIVENPLAQLLTASVINIPGAIAIARIMLPERPATTDAELPAALSYGSTMEAISRGTADGVRLVVNVGAMLIVLVSLVALVNIILGALPGGLELTLQRILGWAFAPVAFLMGIPWSESAAAGSLLGTKFVLNELIAYVQMSQLPAEALSPRSDVIMTYALCGFANLGSLGILIGGLQTMAPERSSDILSLAPRALYSGTLVTCISGAIVGLIY